MSDLDPNALKAKQEIIDRLSVAMRALNEQPETILALLDRLEIPWQKVNSGQTIQSQNAVLVIDWPDLLAGEKRQQDQGSVLKRLYGNNIQEPEKSEPEFFETKGFGSDEVLRRDPPEEHFINPNKIQG